MIRNTLTSTSLLGMIAAFGVMGIMPAAFAVTPSSIVQDTINNNVQVSTQLNVQMNTPVAVSNNIAAGVAVATGSGSASLIQAISSSISQSATQNGANGNIQINVPNINQNIQFGNLP